MKVYDPELHVYRASTKRLPGSTDTIREGGLVDLSWVSEEARWRGKCIHRAIELLNRGTLDWTTVDPSLIGYVRSFENFVRVSKFEIVGCEEPCWSDSFGCLPDLWGFMNGANTIVELKSGIVPGWAAFQTALQQRALKDDKNFIATKRFGLRLMSDGSIAKLRPFTDRYDDYRAMGLVDMFHWKITHKIIKDWN